jgi:hypothetical protein
MNFIPSRYHILSLYVKSSNTENTRLATQFAMSARGTHAMVIKTFVAVGADAVQTSDGVAKVAVGVL